MFLTKFIALAIFLISISNKVNAQENNQFQHDFDTIYRLNYIFFNTENYELKQIPANLYVAETNSQTIIFNEKFEKLTAVDAFHPRVMSDNTLLVKINGLWGLINNNGTKVLDTVFDTIDWQGDTLVLINKDEAFTFNPQNGKISVFEKSSSIQ